MSRRDGFSLVELAVVLILTGAVLTIAMPRVDQRELAVRAADRELSMSLLGAQQRAVLRQHDVRVVFDTAARAVILHDDADNDGVRDVAENIRRMELPDGVYFTQLGTPSSGAAVTFRAGADGLPAVVFHRSGTAGEAGRVHLGTVRSATGREPTDARLFRLERATGRATRHSLEGGAWRAIRVR